MWLFSAQKKKIFYKSFHSLFLEEFNEKREEYASYAQTAQAYQNWKDKTLAYYANTTLSEKEVEELTEDERIKKRNALLDEQFGI